jgi:uncharacterized protein (DUF1800 family)
VGPFIGRQLIQRFVTSNPSPAYRGQGGGVQQQRQGVRGDMRAVLRAVLLDPEARDVSVANQATWGKLREPMIRFGNWMRAFDATGQRPAAEVRHLEPGGQRVQPGAEPLAHSQRVQLVPAGLRASGRVLNRGLVAPEFQITHETTATGYVNFIAAHRRAGYGDYDAAPILPNYSAEIALAAIRVR